MIWNERLLIAPSLICLDLCNLERDIRVLESAGATMLHVDILDGHFSPSMPLGLDTVRQARKLTDLPFDCHVMTTANDFFIGELLDIGVQQIVFHVETEPHIAGALSRIQSAGVRAGVALKPATDLSVLSYTIEQCDAVLLMLINPGYAFLKGEAQVPYAARKVRDLHELIHGRGLETLVELDGRISMDNIRAWGGREANIFVAGTTCINRTDLAGSMERLQQLCKETSGGTP